jgi:secreted Zn-dependent insulinase-like peptidase
LPTDLVSVVVADDVVIVIVIVIIHPVAGLAGLIYEVRILPRGIRLTFGGYNEKLSQFAMYISNKLAGGVRDILPKNDVDFEKYKDQVMRALSAFDVKQPYGKCMADTANVFMCACSYKV